MNVVATLAVHHRDFSSWRVAAHRVQHVGADGYRADGRGNVRLGAILVSCIVVTGAVGYVVSSFSGPFQRGRLWLAAGSDRRPARGHDGQKEPGRAGSAERADSLADLHRCPRICFQRHGQFRALGWVVSGYLLGPIDGRPDSRRILSERRRANLLGWAAGIAVAVSFGFMVLNYLQNT